MIVDKNGPAPCSPACFNIFPPVPDHEAGLKVNLFLLGGLQDQSRLRLSAFARIRVVVIAHADGVHGKSVDKKTVDLFDHFLFGYPSRDIGLVRDANQHVAGLPERFAALVDSRGNLQLRKIRGRIGFSLPYYGKVENPVPIQEDRAPFSYRIGSPSLDNMS